MGFTIMLMFTSALMFTVVLMFATMLKYAIMLMITVALMSRFAIIKHWFSKLVFSRAPSSSCHGRPPLWFLINAAEIECSKVCEIVLVV